MRRERLSNFEMSGLFVGPGIKTCWAIHKGRRVVRTLGGGGVGPKTDIVEWEVAWICYRKLVPYKGSQKFLQVLWHLNIFTSKSC